MGLIIRTHKKLALKSYNNLKMRINHKLGSLKVLYNHLVVYPTPINLNYMWSFGSMAGIVLSAQLVTGILLACHYTAHVDYAFYSVVRIMTEVPSGFILRYAHANGASLFFVVVYLHIFRGMYFSSGNQPRELVWITGVVILLLMIGTAFIGYSDSLTQKLYSINSSSNFMLAVGFVPYKSVKSYTNLYLSETQLKVAAENRQKSGVYMVFNKKNGKFYVGSAITNRIQVRFRNHCFHDSVGSVLLRRAINKYGLESFSFHILEYYAGFVHKDDFKKAHLALLARETFFIELLKPAYNILNVAGSSLGYKLDLETRLKMKANYLEARKMTIKLSNQGQKMTSEQKNLISVKAKLRYMDLNFKKKFLSKIKPINGCKPVLLLNLDSSINKEFESIKQTAAYFYCSSKTINRALKKNKTIFKKTGYLEFKIKNEVKIE